MGNHGSSIDSCPVAAIWFSQLQHGQPTERDAMVALAIIIGDLPCFDPFNVGTDLAYFRVEKPADHYKSLPDIGLSAEQFRVFRSMVPPRWFEPMVKHDQQILYLDYPWPLPDISLIVTPPKVAPSASIHPHWMVTPKFYDPPVESQDEPLEPPRRYTSQVCRRDHEEYRSPYIRVHTSSGPYLDAPCVEAFNYEDTIYDFFPWVTDHLKPGDSVCHTYGLPLINTQNIPVSEQAAIYEVNSQADWIRLVETYPADFSNNFDLNTIFGQEHTFCIPDWAAVAEDYNGVHVSFYGYLMCAYARMETSCGVTTLTNWGPDVTHWLRYPA